MRRIVFLFQELCWILLACALSANTAFAAMSDVDFIKLCEKGPVQQITKAIKDGANVNARGAVMHVYEEYGEAQVETTPLLNAAQWNADPKVIKALIKAGADMNAKIDNRWTALTLAAMSNPNPEVTTVLIHAGAKVDERDPMGDWTPLLQAVRTNPNPAVVEAFVKAGADINASNSYGETALMLAADENPNPTMITALVKAGADVNAKIDVDKGAYDNHGKTALMWAADGSVNPEVLKTLIKAGADVNARNAHGKTALMVAVEEHPEVLPILVRAGADVDAQDDRGVTALMLAASRSPEPEVAVTTLLDSGANPKAKDNSGKMAIDYARTNKNPNKTLQGSDALRKLEEMSR